MKYPPLKVPPDDDGLISLMCCNLKRTSSERNYADDGDENRKGPVLLKFQSNVKKHCGKALGTQLSPFFGPSQKNQELFADSAQKSANFLQSVHNDRMIIKLNMMSKQETARQYLEIGGSMRPQSFL